jgi:mannosyltransferase OCH1-like enzyme
MIPKIIHYCWLSNDPYPSKIQMCINSWKQNLPDYEFKKWDASCLSELNVSWVNEAYNAKKYAFAADYIRFYAIFNFGGVYLDCDVEVKKSLNNLLELPYFIGLEHKGYIEAAILGSIPGNACFGKMLNHYENKSFVKRNGSYNIEILPLVWSEVIDSSQENVLVIDSVEQYKAINTNQIKYFNYRFFSPIHTDGMRYKLMDYEETYCVHHFTSTWLSPTMKILIFFFGTGSTLFYVKKVLKKIKFF